jgi:hypothetical protein
MNKLIEDYGMEENEDFKSDLIKLLNESLVKITEENEKASDKTKAIDKKSSKDDRTESGKRYKSKKAKEYAEEHGIDIEEFDMKDISKKDVEILVREKAKDSKEGKLESPSKEKKNATSSSSKDDTPRKKKNEKVICSGINKKGEACKSVGTIKPNGAKRMYCFRHSEEWKVYECDSDSSNESDDSNDSKEEKEEDLNEKEEDSKEEKEEKKSDIDHLFEEPLAEEKKSNSTNENKSENEKKNNNDNSDSEPEIEID